MPVFTPLLEARLQAIAGFPNVDPSAVARFGEALRARDDYGLFRINPLSFADDTGLSAAESTDLFVVGAKVGLFDFSFNLVCPGCGGIETAHDSWNGFVDDAVWCALCRVHVPVVLDEQVEVSFTIAEAAARIDVQPHRSREDYLRCSFSSSFRRSPSHQQVSQRIFRGFLLVEPNATGTAVIEVTPGRNHRAASLDAHSATELVTAEDGAASVEIEVVPGGLKPAEATVRPGPVELRVHNRAARPVGLLLLENALEEIMAARARDPSGFVPFLSAKQLLNHQRFRELFKAQSLDPSLRLKIRSLTLLFTDLKGSTALYDSTGDVTAYAVVQEHFTALTHAVRAHRGAVVKTMGDAVMASFSAPEDAVLAADEMLSAMAPLNARVRGLGHATGLKVGIHEGSALAVASDDRLDYFGQTVNIAARVQALADAGEIWVTEPVMRAPEVERFLSGRGYQAEPRRVVLKGVGQPTDVYRLSR